MQAELQSYSQKDAQLQTQHEVLEESQKHFQQREVEIDEDRRQLDAGRADLDVRQSEFEKKLLQWEQEAEARQEQWRRQEREFQAKRKRWEAKHQEIEARLTEWHGELDAREARLGRQRAPAAEPSDAALSDRRGAGARSNASTPTREPTDALGMGDVSILGRDEGSSTHDETPKAARRGKPETRADDEEGESIDEYMANLMRRLQGIAEIPPEELPSLDEIQPAAVSRQAYLGANHPYRMPEDAEKQDEASQKKPAPKRRAALESMSTLAAMRELAMASASSAITAHTQNRLRKKIRGKLFLSGIAMVLGTVLLLGWMVWGFGGWNLYVGAVGMILSLMWVVQFAVLTGRLTTTRSGNLVWTGSHAKKTRPTPPAGEESSGEATSVEKPAAEQTSANDPPINAAS
ncbi:MAG TPA: hypothetical protein DD670_07230 [Planctomycetaceae bacterium]|nr:hypothetical protein [Planctomycetaceae bacterium]